MASTLLVLSSLGARAEADPIGLQWPQPGGRGSPVFITYSFSNLLDGTFLLLSPSELRAATEESLRLWARYAPLHFIERPDSGPSPSDGTYDPANHPQIRIGHQPITHWAQAYYPGQWDGLAGDIHLSTGGPWTLDGSSPWHFLEVITHELGHAVGLGHEDRRESMMNHVFTRRRYGGLGTAYLFPADIKDIQAIYGAEPGSVQPLNSLPEPATVWLAAAGLAAALARRRRG